MQVSLTNFNSRDAARSGGDASRVRRVLRMSGLPARQLRAKKRSGNAAALLARKVDRAGNEAAELITFIFHLGNVAGAELAAEQKWHRVFRLTFMNFPRFKQ